MQNNCKDFNEYYKIKNGLSPNWALLQYDAQAYEITDLLIIPRHFMTLDAVKARNPLKKTARRASWVGSNVLLKKLPPDARLYVIEDSQIISKRKVRKEWKKFEFMKKVQPDIPIETNK